MAPEKELMMKKHPHYRNQNIKLIGFLILLAAILFIATNQNQNLGTALSIGNGKYSIPIWSSSGQFSIVSIRRDAFRELWLYDNKSEEWKQVPLSSRESAYVNGTWKDNNTYLFTSDEYGKGAIVGNTRLLKLSVSSMSVEILTSMDEDISGTIYPVDSNILFFADSHENQDSLILTMDIKNLTISEYDIQPHVSAHNILWSPDGTRLAYQYAGDGIPRYEGRGIGILENGGKTEFDIPFRIGENIYTWSPDSSAILFVGQYEPDGLYLLNLNEPNSEPTLIRQGRFAEVSWSPDGSMIAYTTLTFTSENELYLVPAEELGLEKYKPVIDDK